MPQSALPVRVVNNAAVGNSFFVNYLTGSDDAPGNAQQPLASLLEAQSRATANNNDAVYLIGSARPTATITWAKNGVNLIGLTSPSNNGRARISPPSGAALFTPMMNVTSQGCSFLNLGTFYGFNDASAQVCWVEAGGRNYYGNCQIQGGGHATAAAQAGMRSITIAGEGENQFVGCTFGLDTISRATNANATLQFLTGTARNIFRDSTFQALSNLAGNCHVLAAAGGLDRYALFDRCAFINAIESTGIAMTAAIIADAAAGGAIILKDPISLGATNLATTGPVYAVGAAADANTTGIAIKMT